MQTIPAQRSIDLDNHADHPLELIAELLALRERSGMPLNSFAICYVGDGELGQSLLLAGAALGMDIRIAAPQELWPPEATITRAEDLAAESGARLLVTSDAGRAVLGAQYVIRGRWRDAVAPGASPSAPSPYLVTEEFIASSECSGTEVLIEGPDPDRSLSGAHVASPGPRMTPATTKPKDSVNVQSNSVDAPCPVITGIGRNSSVHRIGAWPDIEGLGCPTIPL
jgi:hypothetical protein